MARVERLSQLHHARELPAQHPEVFFFFSFVLFVIDRLFFYVRGEILELLIRLVSAVILPATAATYSELIVSWSPLSRVYVALVIVMPCSVQKSDTFVVIYPEQ